MAAYQVNRQKVSEREWLGTYRLFSYFLLFNFYFLRLMERSKWLGGNEKGKRNIVRLPFFIGGEINLFNHNFLQSSTFICAQFYKVNAAGVAL